MRIFIIRVLINQFHFNKILFPTHILLHCSSRQQQQPQKQKWFSECIWKLKWVENYNRWTMVCVQKQNPNLYFLYFLNKDLYQIKTKFVSLMRGFVEFHTFHTHQWRIVVRLHSVAWYGLYFLLWFRIIVYKWQTRLFHLFFLVLFPIFDTWAKRNKKRRIEYLLTKQSWSFILVHINDHFAGLPRMEALVRIANIPIVETGVKTAGKVYSNLKVL